MNKLTEKLAGALAAGALLVTLTPMPAYPQSGLGQVSRRPTNSPQVRGQAAVTLPREKGRIPAGRVVVNKRQPIPFKKFEMRDPKTGQPISPNSTITLRSGRKVTAAQYFGAINELEQKLCAIGYSLRDPQTKSIVQRLNVDQAKLQEQKRRLAARSRAPSVTIDDVDVRLPPKGERTQINTVKRWNPDPLGDPEIMAVFLDAKVQLTGSPTITKVDAEANAGVDFIGKHLNVLRGTVALATPKTGPMNTRVNLSAFGISFFSLDKNSAADFTKSERLSRTFQKSFEYDFTIASIPFSVEIGGSFTVGANYQVNLRPTDATAVLAPSVRSSAFGQAAVDVDVEASYGIASAGAEAGVEGRVILLNDDLTLQGQLSIDLDPSGKPFFFERYSGVNNLEALSGYLAVYLEVCGEVLGFGGCKKYSETLWEFDGFKDNRTLFNGSKKTFIN